MPLNHRERRGHRHGGQPPASVRHNLRAQPAPIIGRDQDVKAIHERLRDEVRLITLVGAPGIGKTRLAVAAVVDLLDDYMDGVWFVDLASISSPALVSSTIARTLGLEEGGEEALNDRLRQFLRDKQILLVLDNFEQVVTAARDVAALLETCPSLKIMVTSREALHLRWEHQYAVPPLAMPDVQRPPDPKVLAQAPAVALFVERARAVGSDFALTTDNAGEVAQICTRLDGLPLAIELAAAHTDVQHPREILAGLRRSSLNVLVESPKDSPGRHETLRTAIAWSRDLLKPDEQALFRRLGVFVGGCTVGAAEAVCSIPHKRPIDVHAGIAALVRKSLLQRMEGAGAEPRFRMLEMVREYAAEQLAESGEDKVLRQRYQDWAVAFAEDTAGKLRGTLQVESLSHLDRDHDNLRAALVLAAGTPDGTDIVSRLARALWWFWYLRGHLSEGRGWLDRALAGSVAATPARAEELIGAGWLAYGQGNLAQAAALLEESLAISRELADQLGMARALMPLGFIVRDQGDYERARLACEESLTLSREIGYRWGTAYSLYLLALVAGQQGDFGRFAELCAESLPLFRELGDRFGTAYVLQSLGRTALAQDDYDRAAARYEECLTLSRELGNRRGICFGLVGLGHVARRRGSYDQATALYADALRRWQELGNSYYIAYSLDLLASMAAARKQPERAVRLFGAAAGVRETIGAPLPIALRAAIDYDKTLAALRRRFGEARFSTTWEAGRALSAETAVAEALVGTEPAASALGGTEPVETAGPSGPLTPREREVAILIARGLTNRQIASELVITEGTAASHVEHIRDKLDFHSRSQIAAWAIARGLIQAPRN